MSKIIEIVKDALDLRDVDPSKIEKTPFLVKQAILDLQSNSKILPPKILEFAAGDKKEEKRDTDFDVFFNFIYLPEDFIELAELFVFDSKGEEHNTGFPYQKTPYENYINKLRTGDTRKFFTITDIIDPNDNYRKALIMNPYPDDGTFVRIKYFVDGSEESLDFIKPVHWKSIIKHVEGQLGIRPEEDAVDSASEDSARWRNQSGKSSINGSPMKTRGSYFGNTPQSRTTKNRLR